MNRKLISHLSPVILIPLLWSCGVVVSEGHSLPRNHYVSLTLSDFQGRGNILARECIDLWDIDHGGTIDVDGPWLSSDLRIDWRNFAGEMAIDIVDGSGTLSSHSFDEDFFRDGGQSEFVIQTFGQDYILHLEGPYCY